MGKKEPEAPPEKQVWKWQRGHLLDSLFRAEAGTRFCKNPLSCTIKAICFGLRIWIWKHEREAKLDWGSQQPDTVAQRFGGQVLIDNVKKHTRCRKAGGFVDLPYQRHRKSRRPHTERHQRRWACIMGEKWYFQSDYFFRPKTAVL